MQLFYKLVLAVVVAAAATLTYDLFQAEIERAGPRIRYDPATKQFTFHKPEVSVRIVYASMFGPGEPVMRVRDTWISCFEEDYSDRLAAQRGVRIPESEKGPFVREALRRIEKVLPRARERLERIAGLADEGDRRQQIEELEDWLEGREIFLAPLPPKASEQEKLQALGEMVSGLADLATDVAPAEKVRVAPRLVTVERRWQGRWVLSANRPRFLTGREVPDIMVGSKMELLALVQDHYAVALNEPLPGETVAPLDEADTYGKPERKWRDAFIPAMLEEGKYDFLDDPTVQGRIYLASLTCSTTIMFYNEVLFQKAGIDRPPRTWPEFIAVCEKLKAAGITPLTADADVYSDSWQGWLILRALGPETWEATISGTPADQPPAQRTSEPPWTDPRYTQIHEQIRLLRERDYFHKDFSGSTWPAAQRGFAKGSAAMMICGSWLVQELAGYMDAASAKEFRLKCFSFPTWPGGREVDQRAAWAVPYGLMVCRQGKATPYAIELVKYLSARDWPDMVHKNAQISCMKEADFPPDLAGIEEDFRSAPAIYNRTPNIYARRFASQVISPRYREFFLQDKGDSGYVSAERFLTDLDKHNAAYLANGGEEGFE